MTLQYDLILNQGEDVQIVFPVVDANNNPITVTGWTAKGQVRRHASPTAGVLYEWSSTYNNVTVSGTNVTIKVRSGDSAAWPWRVGFYDLKLTDTSGNVTRLAEGNVRVIAEVTQ